jgi:hypothetical protein
MTKVTIKLNDPAASAASYTHIQLGRAANEADANSQTGTFYNIGSIATINQYVGVYDYVDTGSPSGYWYTYRLWSSSSSGSWATAFQGRELGYLTVSEFRDYELGAISMPDGTESTDNRLERLISVASSMVDSYCGFSFQYLESTEQHSWNQNSRRVYPYNSPIISVDSLEVFVSNQQRATFNLSDLFINTSQNYVEVTSLANVTYSLFPAIVALGLIQPVAKITYKHGFKVTPHEIKDATAMIAIDLAARDSLYQTGMGLLTKLTVGDTTMERLPQVAAGRYSALSIPPTAAAILDQYMSVSLR